ncbi:MAG: WD40 repeat domain-containing protein [Acidobacteria bacterium]|nr:WD40 repeat domain-containing protein [Acidobacteriota bacterium]MBV9187776.1 WD40 repeat domain-containing protein [Acidobacteriota bacterium]
MKTRRPSTRIILVSAILLFSHRAFAQFLQQGPKLVGTGFIANARQGGAVAFSADGNTAIVGGSDDRVTSINDGVGAAWIWIRSGAFWIQQGPKLAGVDALGSARQGTSVAISADGNTAIVGGPGDNLSSGAAWIWTRSAGVWTQQGPKLVIIGGRSQGTSVSLSADGNTAIIGAPDDHNGVGAAWVWTRNGGVWTQQGPSLVSAGVVRQGQSVALSADGNTAIIGAPFDSKGGDAACVWTRNGGVWSQQGNKLTAVSFGSSSRQGTSVAISADGDTAIVGGPGDNNDTGAAWIWTRNAGVWTQQGKLFGSDATGGARQGTAVSLSADGNTALVGGPGDTSRAGAVWVWTRTEGLWRQSGKLTVTGPVDADTFDGLGVSAALSADGNTAIAGRNGDDSFTGAAWVWTRSGGTWNQQSKLVGAGAQGSISQGSGVAVSGDGNTAIVGAIGDHYRAGAAWIWTRSGGFWTQQSIKLVGSGAVGRAQQGSFVAISADANTALVGGFADDGGKGAVWVWTRENGIWTQQGTKLVGSGAVGAGLQGISGALSADGNTAIIGGFGDNGSLGAAWVWTRSGGIWIQQGPKLSGSGAVRSSVAVNQGFSVALSADGNTAIVGGAGDDQGKGAAWVWTRSEGAWTQQGPKLVVSDTAGAAGLGFAVSLSADGNTALLGGIHDNISLGAAWIWTRSAGIWTQQGPKLVGSGAVGMAYQGYSVSLSADGNTALIGGYYDNNTAGAAWVWKKSGGIWTQFGPKLVGAGAVGPAGQSASVSLSADGRTAIVGGFADDRTAGAAWVFAVPQRQRAIKH